MNRIDHCFLGDCRESMRQMIANGYAGRIQCIVTSPPYWGLRDYGCAGQLGLEPTIQEFIANMGEVFALCHELLADDGTLWMNMGDCYATGAGKVNTSPGGGTQGERWSGVRGEGTMFARGPLQQPNRMPQSGLKPKDLVGQPWRLAFALQDAGWYLRQDIIWHKPNPMPESVRDRCTKAHEYLFLLTKSERYYFDQEAILEPVSKGTHARLSKLDQGKKGSESANIPAGWASGSGRSHSELSGRYSDERKVASRKLYPGTGVGFGHGYDEKMKPRVKNNESFDAAMAIMPEKRNRRSVWTIPTESYKEAHFATFPRALVEPCILAGSRPGDIVFDPFLGSGTTAQVAQALGRHWLGCELNPDYLELQRSRTIQPSFMLGAA